MTRFLTRAPAALAAALVIAGCSAGSGVRVVPVPAPTSTARPASSLPGALSSTRMSALVLQGDDVPGLTLRAAVDPDVEAASSPQLALCRPPGPAAPHQVANVLAKGSAPGQAQVFELVAVYADAAAASRAYDYDAATARACGSFTDGERSFTVPMVSDLALPGARAVQYRLAASDVVSGELRILAVRGRAAVLLSSFGAPPDGSDLATYQTGIARRALARVTVP